jgi:hypothetical protein
MEKDQQRLENWHVQWGDAHSSRYYVILLAASHAVVQCLTFRHRASYI